MIESDIQRRSITASFLPLALLLFSAGPAAGREAMHLPAFREAVDVRMINLEVAVTRRGERVSGLAASDFSLRVDGQEMPIAFFTEVAGGRAVTAPGPGSEGTVPGSGPGAGFPSLESGARVGTRFLLFIDDDFAVAMSRNRVLERLAGQLDGLDELDRMAVVAFDGRRLELLSGWTRSLARLASALDEARQRRAYGLLRRNELQGSARGRYGSRSPAGSSFSSTGFLGFARAVTGTGDPTVLRYSDDQAEISQVVRAATSALRGLLGSPGRKVMLLLAGGWPAYPRWGDRDAFDRYDSQRALFAPLVDTANQLGYTLYPVAVEANGTAIGAASRAATRAEQERKRLFEDTLHYLADETGGRALVGGARLTALERAIEDTRSYYWLGFTPAWNGDGEEHRLEVEVLASRSGKTPSDALEVRTRQSFSDLSRQLQVSMWIESAHLFDTPLPDSAELTVEIGEPQPAGAGKVLLPLSLDVPLDQVTMLPVEDDPAAGGQVQHYRASLEFRVAATDVDGATANLPVAMVEIVSQTAPEPGQIGSYQTRLKLRRKRHRLLISLYDPLTGNLLARRIDFEP